MTFYERYAKICAGMGIEPCSQKAADLIGVTKATISVWNTRDTAPKGETVAAIANAMHTTTDYLLGRTEYPADTSTVAAAQKPIGQTPAIVQQYYNLDDLDRIKVDAYTEGLLAADKYAPKKQA